MPYIRLISNTDPGKSIFEAPNVTLTSDADAGDKQCSATEAADSLDITCTRIILGTSNSESVMKASLSETILFIHWRRRA